MNCYQFSTLTGMRCEPQETYGGEPCIAVVTPFSFFDGDGLTIFARTIGEQIHLFDDGATLFWLRGLGLRTLDDRRSWRPLRTTLSKYNVGLSEDGTIELMTPQAGAAGGFARMVSGLLAVDAWARENAGQGSGLPLEQEASLYLRAWRPDLTVETDPVPIVGMSGAEHRFALRQGDEYIDTIGSSQTAVGAEARKLIDIRSKSEHGNLPIRVIIDDRAHPERAQREASIIGRLANAWTMSKLIETAGGPQSLQ